MTGTGSEIILASASLSRRKLLEAAGVIFRAEPAGVDEAAIKRDYAPLGAGFDRLAVELAVRKAEAVAANHPGSTVIGADQILVFEGRAFDKPGDVETAREQLLELSGLTHSLETAVACVRGQDVLWSHVEAPRLKMRDYSPRYVDSYLAAEDRAVTETVGGYRIEGRGIQLFDEIAGDYFSILGLPLLPLLAFLRGQGLIPT